MKTGISKNIKLYIVSLLVSLIYFSGFFYMYFVAPLNIEGTHIDYGIVFTLFVLPLIFLYAMGLGLCLTSNENKRNTLGWVMMAYTFIYLTVLILYLSSGVSGSCGSNTNEAHPYIIETVVFLLNVIAIWYLFEGLMFLACKMKKHLYAAARLLILIVILTLFAGVS
jgi:hypothetical protein